MTRADESRSIVDSRKERIGLKRLLVFLLPTAFALYANFQGVQLILLPAQIEAIDPSRKIDNLALLTIFCAVSGVAGLMAGGGVSDATRSRWGRRAPWLAAMAGGFGRDCDIARTSAPSGDARRALRRLVVHAQFFSGRDVGGRAGSRAG